MADLNGFDARQVEPTTRFDPVPAAKYTAMIIASEWKQTKAGTGRYLALTFQVLEGEHKGRLLWSRLNLENANALAVQIARAELSAVCRAIGVLMPQDSTDLHNLPLIIDVRCKKRSDTGEIANEIKAFAKKESAPPAAPATASDTPPWKRAG
jgi:hypothetical protein